MLDSYEDVIPGGRHWSMVVRRGVALTLTDLLGAANVGMVMFNAENPLERLNLPDTLKCQHTLKITQGHCLYTDMGRVLCSVVHDDLGWHDPSCGTCNADLVARKWGASTYQDVRNDYLRNGRDSFLIELAKYGLGKRDVPANVNWFSRVDVGAAGELVFNALKVPGAELVLRFEMDTIVALHTCPHPLNDAPEYPRADVRYRLAKADPVTADDECFNACPENERGWRNTELYYLGR